MKKIFVFSVVAAASMLLAFAAPKKEVFVKEAQVLSKVDSAKSNSKKWPSSVAIFKDDMSAAKSAQKNWTIERGELKGAEGASLVIKNAKGVYAISLEFNADEAGEGCIFVRAPKGDVSKAVRIKLCQLNSDKGETSIGSINGVIKPGNKFNETKDGRWSRIMIFVEENGVRVTPNTNLCGHYADRNFLTYKWEDISKKSGYEVAGEGEAGFLCEKGNLKFKNITITVF